MSYKKQGFKSGDILFSRQLNAMDDQIAENEKNISATTSAIAEEARALGLHCVPENQGVLNAIKRARQLTDIEWTPSEDIPFRYFGTIGEGTDASFKYVGGFKAGVKYRGVPYATTNVAGNKRPLRAFITALNPSAAMSVFTPGPTNTNSDKLNYIGAVCSDLVSYAINRPTTNSTNFHKVNGLTLIGAVSDNTVDDIQLGDIISKPAHCSLVTDIIKDSDGRAAYIEISEATSAGVTNYSDLYGEYGGLARRRMRDRAEFVSSLSADGSSIYRFGPIDKVPYTPDPYVPMPGEGYTYPEKNIPVVPICGDRALITSASLRLIVNMTATADTRGAAIPSFTHVVVRRNGELYGDPLEILTQETEQTVTYSSSLGSKIKYPAGSKYVTVNFNGDDEAIFTARIATMVNDVANEFGKACSFIHKGPTNNRVPDNRTVLTSSGGYKYLDRLVDGTHEFTIQRKSRVWYPYAVGFGNESSGYGSRGGCCVNVYEYTVEPVTVDGEQWYEYHFYVDAPKISGNSIAPATVFWWSDEFGCFELSATTNTIGNDGKNLYYNCN